MSSKPTLYSYALAFLQIADEAKSADRTRAAPDAALSPRSDLSEASESFVATLTGAGSAETDPWDEQEADAALSTLHAARARDRNALTKLAAAGLSREASADGDLVLRSGADRLLAIRRAPILSTQLPEALPAWTSGLATERLIGPVHDAFGRDIWIHVFRIVRQVRFVRTPGGVPFLSVPHAQLASVFAPAAEEEHDLAAGSLWMATSLFATVPSDTYSGVRIAGGTLTFSSPIAISGDEVVVPPAVTCALEVTLDPPARDTSGVPADHPGADARATTFDSPDGLRIKIGPAGNEIVATGEATIGAFGEDVAMSPAPSAPSYLAAFNRLLVPMDLAESEFTVTASEAADFEVSGEAPITGGGLALPAARIAPAFLGEAAGVGALMLQIDPGLSARVSSETVAGPLNAATIMVDELRLALTAFQAEQDGRRTTVRIGDALPPSLVDIGRATEGSLRYFAQTGGQEAVQYSAKVDLRPDLPRDVAGDRIPIHLPAAVVIIAQIGTEGALALFGRARDVDRRRCFQLKNGLLRANAPLNALLYGLYDGETVTAGALWASYRLDGIVPTLPDPYAANIGLRTKQPHRGAQLLISRFAFAPGTREVDFFLPGAAPVAVPANGDLALSANPATAMATTSPGLSAAAPAATAAAASNAPGVNWPEVIGDALDFEFVPKITLVDVSSGAGQLGVALRPGRRRPQDPIGSAPVAPTPATQPLAIADLALEVDPNLMVLLTLPAVQWEPVVAVPPEIDELPPFPDRVVFLNSGVPAVVDIPDGSRVPIAPVPAYDSLLERLDGDNHPPSRARFTLPFGMIASARLTPPTNTERGARVRETRPEAPEMRGAHQLSLRARDRTLPSGKTPALPGHTVQLPVALPAGPPGPARSVLGDSVTFIFNDNLGAASPEALVPLTRIDLSGYGESAFSKWINPKNAMTQVDKVELDVPVGRAGREVVQVRSVLLPYGVPVVRTITLQRKADAIVGRSDSGWVAAGDGDFGFSGAGTVTHPGVVRRITNVEEIRETGQRITAEGQEFVAVYFQGDLILDGADDPVPVKRHLGYVRLTADPPPFGVAAYAGLIEQAGPMCGPLDAVISVAGGAHQMRLKRVGVAVAGSEFAMAAWGSLIFPGGEWSVLETPDASGAPAPVPEDQGLPLIRQGAAGTPTSAPYRFADPEDLLNASPAKDYGILHSMGMQRAFYRRPRIEPDQPNRIVSTERPILADPFILANSVSVFPEQADCIPFPSANFALETGPSGAFVLDGPGTFPAGIGRRTTASSGSVQSDVDYSNSDVTYEVDTSDAVPWRFELTNATRIMAHTDMGDVVTTVAQIRAEGTPDSRFEEPKVQIGGPVQIVQDLLTIMEDLGIAGEPDVRMENKPKFTFGMKVPFVDPVSHEDLQIPPLPDPQPLVIFADTGVGVSVTLSGEKSKAKFFLEGKPMFAIKAIPGLYAVAIIKFTLIMSTMDGVTFVITIGFGVAYSTKLGPLKLKGLVAFTFIGIIGETVMGWGGGILVKAEAAIKPIISVGIRFEAMGARLIAQQGTGNETVFFVSKVSVSIDISVFLVLSFSVTWEAKMVEITRGPLEKKDAPDVL